MRKGSRFEATSPEELQAAMDQREAEGYKVKQIFAYEILDGPDVEKPCPYFHNIVCHNIVPDDCQKCEVYMWNREKAGGRV